MRDETTILRCWRFGRHDEMNKACIADGLDEMLGWLRAPASSVVGFGAYTG